MRKGVFEAFQNIKNIAIYSIVFNDSISGRHRP